MTKKRPDFIIRKLMTCKCGEEFTRFNWQQKYCSKECQSRFYRDENGLVPTYPGISTSTVGTISELIVAVDLLKRGYDVFRALSPTCSCDLAFITNGRLVRVEVRTSRKLNGRFIVKGRP